MPRFEAGSRALLELLRAYSVNAVFAGHVHRAQTVDVPGAPQLVISGTAGAPQGWTRAPQYGYHRVTVNGAAETRVEFVELNKGQHVPVEHVRSHASACPKIDNTYDR